MTNWARPSLRTAASNSGSASTREGHPSGWPFYFEAYMLWRISNRADPVACSIADRHYNRQKPGSPQFVPPGRCMVLLSEDATALWVTSWPFAEYVKHRWPGAWVNSCFRREGGARASDLIRDAIAATRWFYGDPPPLGIVTFIDRGKVRPRRAGYGKCYLAAGFESDGETEGGLLAFRLKPENMPLAVQPFASDLFMAAYK
jgi:hypothetical protein